MDDYASPDGRKVGVQSNMAILFSDGFGGSAIDATKWDVIDGGLGANPTLGGFSRTQVAIGSGVTGITDSVASSVLTVTMGTTTNAERWYLSKGTFAGAEDVTIILNRPSVLAENTFFVGLVEVDPATNIPLPNGTISGDFTNRGGVDFAKQASNQSSLIIEAIEDNSGVLATTGATIVNAPTAGNYFETTIEFHAEDIIASTTTPDSTLGRQPAVARLSSQVPNDNRKYKLLMRFKNNGTPGGSSQFLIQRIIVVNNQELRVEVASGRGDAIAQKGLPVNVANPAPVASSTKLFSAATTNANIVKASQGWLMGGLAFNFNAAARYLKLYNKATAPTVGTDAPIFTVPLPAGSATVPSIVSIMDLVGAEGHLFTTGIALAITGALADADTTAIGANDVVLALNWF